MTLTNYNTIGIIGGMGPDASARLYQLMIDMARDDFGAKANHEYPELLIYSIPVPDFISDTSQAEEAMFMLKSRVRYLSQLPMSCTGLACNTAHTTLVDLNQISNVPFVSMPDEVANHAKKKKYQSIGLLATPTTVYSGIYQTALAKVGIKTVSPNYDQVEELGSLIGLVVAGKFKPPKKRLLIIADSLKKKKIDALVLGCTELPLVFPKNYSLPVLDSLNILAQTLLKRYYQKEVI